MKSNIEILVHDWNPNGTNDISIIKNNTIQEYGLDEVTFGIDINKYGAFELQDNCYAAVVPLKVVIANLAVSPVRTSSQAYKRLMELVNQ